jgi:predicted dehydrogenase
MEAARDAGAIVAAIAEPARERREAALAIAPDAVACDHLGQLLELPLDGVVIATPSALHAEQAQAALGRGLAVFCQKPLARRADEARAVVAAARAADRLLGVDLSYRHTAAVRAMRSVIASGGIGTPFAANLVFHNAYGPDAKWFYARAESGGGCVIDLGVHLIDLALWMFDWPEVTRVTSSLHAMKGADVEDHAAVQLELANGVAVQLACSWRISAGRDCAIEASFYGTDGGVAMRNEGGSFFDFTAERFAGTRAERIASPPDDWGGRAIAEWVARLADGARFDAEAERHVTVTEVLDRIYGEESP